MPSLLLVEDDPDGFALCREQTVDRVPVILSTAPGDAVDVVVGLERHRELLAMFRSFREPAARVGRPHGSANTVESGIRLERALVAFWREMAATS